MVHEVIKPEKIAALGAVALEQELTLPKRFARKSFDAYKFARDDKVNITIEGVLPYRLKGFRWDRADELVFDEYQEKTIQVGFDASTPYSAVYLTDEQNEFDLGGWAKLAGKQGSAIGRGLNQAAAQFVQNGGSDSAVGATPFAYPVELGVPEYALRWGLTQARAIQNRLMAPGKRTLIIGTDWELALLNDEKLNLAQNVGDSEAVSALRNATIGHRFGYDIIVDPTIPADEAYALTDQAFVWLAAAPTVPQSVPFGATASHEGVPLRWLRDYETEKWRDRSVFNLWSGFHVVTDTLAGYSHEERKGIVGTHQHFVRGIKLKLASDKAGADAAMKFPRSSGSGVTDAEKELQALTDLKAVTAPTFEAVNPALNVTVQAEAPGADG